MSKKIKKQVKVLPDNNVCKCVKEEKLPLYVGYPLDECFYRSMGLR